VGGLHRYLATPCHVIEGRLHQHVIVALIVMVILGKSRGNPVNWEAAGNTAGGGS